MINSQTHKRTKKLMKSSILSTLLLIAFSFSSNLSHAQDSSLSSSDSSLLQDSLVGYVYSTSCYKPTVLVSNILQFQSFSRFYAVFSEPATLEFQSESGESEIVNSEDGEVYVQLHKNQDYDIFIYDNCGERELLKTIKTSPIEPESFAASRDFIIKLGRWSDQDEDDPSTLFEYIRSSSFVFPGELASFLQHKEFRGQPFLDDVDDFLDDYTSTRWWTAWDSIPVQNEDFSRDLTDLLEGYTPPLPNDCNCTILFGATQDVTPVKEILDHVTNDYSATIISEPLVEHMDIGSKGKAKWWYDMHTAGPATFEQMQSKTIKVHNRIAIKGDQGLPWLSKLSESSLGSKRADVTYLMLCNRGNLGNVAFPEDCACDREIEADYYYNARMIANATRGNQHNLKEKSTKAEAKLTARYYEYRGNDGNAGVLPIAAAAAGVASTCDFEITDGYWDNYVDLVATGVKIYVQAKTLGGVPTDSIDFTFKRDSVDIDTTLVGTAEDIANSILSILNSEPDLIDSLSAQIKRIINTPYWSEANCTAEDITDTWLESNGTYRTVLRPNESLTLSLQSTTRHEFKGLHSWYTHSAIVPDYALSTVLLGGNSNTVSGQNCCSPYIVVGSAKGSKDDATAKSRAADPISNYALGKDKWQYGNSTGKATIPQDQNLWRFVEWKGIKCDNTGGLQNKRSGENVLLQSQIFVNNLGKTIQINNVSKTSATYQVLDVNGRIIQHTTNLPSGISTLPSSLRNGMYLIKFVTPTTQFVKRAIIY